MNKAAHWLSRIATNTASISRRSGRATFCEIGTLPSHSVPEDLVLGEHRDYLADGRCCSARGTGGIDAARWEGLPAEEVARHLRCSKATVRSHIANARTRCSGIWKEGSSSDMKHQTGNSGTARGRRPWPVERVEDGPARERCGECRDEWPRTQACAKCCRSSNSCRACRGTGSQAKCAPTYSWVWWRASVGRLKRRARVALVHGRAAIAMASVVALVVTGWCWCVRCLP